jgi:hypothetical protein
LLIYALVDPSTREVRYVGKTKRTLRSRLQSHVRDSHKLPQGKTIRYVHRWLLLLERQNLSPEIWQLADVGDTDGCEAEKIWIQFFRDTGARLTNLTDGGDGTLGYKFDLGVVEQIAAKNRAHWKRPEYRAQQVAHMTGAKLSDETKQKMSEAHKGQKRSAETRQKMSQAASQHHATHPHPGCALTSEQVLEIRQATEDKAWGIFSQLARQYRVSNSIIHRVHDRTAYKWVI